MGLENVPTWFGSETVDTLVSYLRGNAVGFRQRGSILGDIVNSSPEVVAPTDNYGYGSWAGFTTVPWKQSLGTSYKDYLTAKKAAGSAPAMAYVGANDGFLHAFNATATGGAEVFAFMPYSALGHIAELANPAYVHRYYVDGLLTAGDAYYAGSWHTVLVGSTGAGGASQAPSSTRVGRGSVFGLDISDPTRFDEDAVLWELSGQNDNDMGFVLGKPVIVAVKGATGPRFVAMFGNGVNSANGQPTLFVVDIQTGQVLRRLKPTGHNVRNGLMNIAPIALKNFDKLVDTVYGGDMEGNLWKFDLSDANPANWNIAYSGNPVFTATRNNVAQPITGGLEVSSGPGGGVSIFFGTGRYFADGDDLGGTTLPVQSIYGIWDNMVGPVGGRGDLVGQTITETPDSNGYQTRAVSNNAVNYTVKRGWYVDLAVNGVGKGERFIGNPNIQNGRVFFTTYTTGEASCDGGGGINWLYGLNLLTGAGAMSGVTTSINGTSVCSGNCGAVALGKGGSSTDSPPTKDTNIFVPKLTPCDPTQPGCDVDKLIGAEQCTFVLRAVGADPLYLPRPCGRQSWRQVR
jgi:type IV pilus assembly protein PilY1